MTPDAERERMGAELAALRTRHAELERRFAVLQAEAESIQLAVRGTSDGLWSRDLASGAERWSERFRALIGFAEDELSATTDHWASLLHPDDRERVLAALDRHLADGEPYDVEYRLRTRERGYRWFLARGTAERDATGRPTRMAGSIQDIDLRKGIERELRTERDFRDSLINSSLDGILAFDPEFKYTLWNPGMERISGLPATEVLGRCAFDVFPFLLETGEDRSFRAALAGRTHVTLDRPYTVPSSGRQGFFEGYYSPLRNDTGAIIGGLGIVRDVTERKQAEQQREELQARLRQSQKMEAIGLLAGGIAHDFNNLLTAILGSAQLALRKLDTPSDPGSLDEAREGLRTIEDASVRAGSLTRQLLTFGRRQVTRAEVVEVEAVVRELTAMLQPLLREDIAFELEVTPPAGRIEVDVAQLEQALMNLIVNARDAMPDGGRLGVSCGVEPIRPPAAGGGTNAPASDGAELGAVIRVSDTGVGMDAAAIEQAFEPFYTTKPMGQGTGLGLSIVYGVMKQAGGLVAVESEPGVGTTFRLAFPLVDTPLSPRPAPAPEAERSAGEVVLVCEDQAAVREVLCKTLRSQGYSVLEVASAEAALDTPRDTVERLDLLVTDIMLPGLSGRALADRLRAERPDLRVLFISGYADDESDAVGVRSGRQDYLGKPFQPSTLLARVRRLLDG